ncbi:MAG: hypothetical protein JJE55_07995 [Flavobacteriaceae bacterium]|nr:hypothetical protein [Flavobacteriaceae bacterium]
MKNLILFSIFLSVFAQFASAQVINIPEPEFIGQIVYVNDENIPQDLEMQTATYRQGASAGRMITGVGKVKGMVVVKGNHSPMEIKKTDVIHFVYNNGDNSIVPTKVAQLLRFTPEKKTREYMYINASNVTGQTTAGELNLISYKGKKYGENSYLIEVSNLDVGEYAFFLGEKESRDAYLFSVIE